MLNPLLIYADYHASATVTATDTKAGLLAADVLQPEEDNLWKPANVTGSKTLTIDQYLTPLIGAVGIVGDYLNGVTLSVYGSNDNFTGENVQLLAPSVMPEYLVNYYTWANISYRYIRLIFSGFGLAFAVAHVALCKNSVLPYLVDNLDPMAYVTSGEQIVSPDGYYIGGHKLRTMINTGLDFGQLTEADYIPIEAWATVCLKGMRPFIYVPDSSASRCFLAWVEKPAFSAPYSNGLRKMAKIPIVARMV